MKKNLILFIAASACCFMTQTLHAQSTPLKGFEYGPVITQFGMHAKVPNVTLSPETQLKVAFDVAAQGEGGKVNRKFDSLARFLNMHVAAGVPKQNIKLALVVHGKASMDLLEHEIYTKVHQQDNANKALLIELMSNNVAIFLCGQSAAAYEINHSQLIKGVDVELSAMTAHALLQQQGYTVNPF